MNPIRMIKNLFKIAKLVSVDDSGDYQFASVTTLGKTQKVLMFKPYGLISSPPVDSIVALFSQQGQESNGIGIADDPKNRPIKDLVSGSGEAGLANYTTGNFIFMDSDGSTQLVSAKDLIATITGDVLATITGDFIADANEFQLNGDTESLTMYAPLNTALQGFITTFNGHTHKATVLSPNNTTLDLSASEATTLKTDG